MTNPIQRVLRRVGESDPLLLAHHPTCEYYDHHTFELYGQQLCMGCFVVYPVGLLSLATLVATRLALPGLPLFEYPAGWFYGIGGALLAPMLADKALPDRRSGRARMAAKAALAVGLALLAFPAVFRPAVRLQTAALFVGFLLPYVAYKGLTVRDDCAGCPEYDDFPNCSGMTFDDAYRWDDGPDAGSTPDADIGTTPEPDIGSTPEPDAGAIREHDAGDSSGGDPDTDAGRAPGTGPTVSTASDAGPDTGDAPE